MFAIWLACLVCLVGAADLWTVVVVVVVVMTAAVVNADEGPGRPSGSAMQCTTVDRSRPEYILVRTTRENPEHHSDR
jgi:hypothetical protein